MFPLATMMGGMATATVPDVCLVPAAPSPIPTPFPNIGQVMQTIPVTATKFVKVMNQAVIVKASQIAMTNGDQAGTAGGGVKSHMIMGPGKFTTYSMTVKFEGQNACYHSCLTEHNGSSSNTIGMMAVPSQPMVLIAP